MASALFIARMAEVILDPIIGYLSDQTKSRFGSRKPWLVAGVCVMPVAVYFLFHPDQDSDWFYFMVWASLFYLSWGTIYIPYRAWGAELSRDYRERSTIFTVVGIAYVAGALLFSIIPILPFSASSGMSPEMVHTIGIAIIVLFPLTVFLSVKKVRQGQNISTETTTFKGLFRSVLKNKPFRILLAGYMTGGIAAGVLVGCWFFYFDVYLGIGDKFSYSVLAFYLGTFFALPFWLKIILRLGKHKAWALGWGVSALILSSLYFINTTSVQLLVLIASAVFFFYGITSSIELAAPYSLLADVIDYDILKTSVNRAANYNALLIIAEKANLALGGALAYFILDAFGYDVKGQANDAVADMGFMITMVIIPSVLYFSASIILWHFPIDSRRHGVIRKRIEALEERLQKYTDPLVAKGAVG